MSPGGGAGLEESKGDVRTFVFHPDKAKSRLGGGAFGETYCMRDTDDGVMRAVKFINVASNRNFFQKIKKKQLTIDETLDIIKKEAQNMNRLHHANIVQYVRSFEHLDVNEGRQFVIVMELVEGGNNLQKVIEQFEAASVDIHHKPEYQYASQ